MRKIKICDIVRNSVWYDPRVIKQIDEYYNNGFDLYIVGEEDGKYKEDEVSRLRGIVKLVMLKEKYKIRRHKLDTLRKEIYLHKEYVKKIVECKPDIIHANDLNALIPAYFAAKKIKCKIIYDSHEICTENIGLSSFKKTLLKVIERVIIKRVDLVVCVSNAAAEYIAQIYNMPKPLVVTNCTNKQLIDESIVKSDKFEVLNHGQFYEGRGYELMVDAAKLTCNDNICYVLRGYGKLETKLRQSVIDNNLSNVKFAPPVKTRELITYAKKSSIGLAITLPINLNFKVSVSNKIFEYLAAGLPVIMSDIPEHRYLNEKYNFGIVLKENSPEALNEAVEILYNNKELYDMYAKNAQTTANELNWETEFKKLVDFELKLVECNE